MASFARDVRAWTKDVVEAFHEASDNAVARVLIESNIPKSAGGLMPVDTGVLRASACTNGVVGIDNIKAGLASAVVRGKHSIGYNAFYANYVEGGTSKQAPQPFLRTAILKHRMFLAEEARKV